MFLCAVSYRSCNDRILRDVCYQHGGKKASLLVRGSRYEGLSWAPPFYEVEISFYWMDSSSDSSSRFTSRNARVFFLKISPTVLNSIGIFILSSFPGEFLLTYSRVFRSEEWLAFKNRGLKFGERESFGSCREEKHFGSWRWIKVSQQGAAADLLPLIIPELFWGGHLLQLQLSHWCTWIDTASGTGTLQEWNDSKKNKFWCN